MFDVSSCSSCWSAFCSGWWTDLESVWASTSGTKWLLTALFPHLSLSHLPLSSLLFLILFVSFQKMIHWFNSFLFLFSPCPPLLYLCASDVKEMPNLVFSSTLIFHPLTFRMFTNPSPATTNCAWSPLPTSGSLPLWSALGKTCLSELYNRHQGISQQVGPTDRQRDRRKRLNYSCLGPFGCVTAVFSNRVFFHL